MKDFIVQTMASAHSPSKKSNVSAPSALHAAHKAFGKSWHIPVLQNHADGSASGVANSAARIVHFVVYPRVQKNPRRRASLLDGRKGALKVANKIAEISSATLQGADRAYLISQVSARINQGDLTGALSVAYQCAKAIFPSVTTFTLDEAAKDIVTKIANDYTTRGLRKNPARRRPRALVARRGGKIIAKAMHHPEKGQRRKAKRLLRSMYGRGVKVNPVKTSKQIFVTCGGKTVALLRDTKENRALAMRLAKTIKHKHPREVVKVAAG